MDDFDRKYAEAVQAGQSNLRAKTLLSNWCIHAEFARSPGRGMIEAETGLPIGHMGVRCKFSKKNSMFCWLLEDAAYDFYLNNCEGCKERIPVGMPNIMSFVGPRQQAAKTRKQVREQQKLESEQKQTERRQHRAELRFKHSLEESFVLDLLDEIDQEAITRDDPRLEELANLAPETFTRNIIEHLLPAVLQENLSYSIPAAKALLTASLRPEEKLAVAVRLVNSYAESPTAIDVILSNPGQLNKKDLINIVRRFVSKALGPSPRMSIGLNKPIQLDTGPIQQLFQKRCKDISAFVNESLEETNVGKLRLAVEIILAIDNDELLEKNARSVVAKLMRRRILLPEEQQDSSLLYYLREAASKCLELLPEETDKIIQSYLADSDDTGTAEAHRAYRSVLKHRYRRTVQIGAAQRIAFKRLLWAAVESPKCGIDEAGQFFMHSWEEFAPLALEHFDDLIGAAATLSARCENVDSESSLELAEDALSHLEKGTKRRAINSLQAALVEWAAIASKTKGEKGIEEYLEIFRKLPADQDQMRANMIIHIAKLLTGVESLRLVLSDWYGALMDESTMVRANAVQAWEGVPYGLVKNFPDLFFEAYSVALTDPYVIVHKSAVYALRRRSFPKNKRGLVRSGLWNLILCYAQESEQSDFVVDCIDAFAFLCLSSEERRGKYGQLLSSVLHGLEGSALYRAVNRLHYRFEDVPGFVKVALKSIQSEYTRSISISDCVTAILKAPYSELQESLIGIEAAFDSLKPFKPQEFHEALLYAAVLTKAEKFDTTSRCFRDLEKSIPIEDRHKQWRLETALIAQSSEIERSIEGGNEFIEQIRNWMSLLSDLENENEERAKLRDFPSGLFSEG